jgi:hypothetical protein
MTKDFVKFLALVFVLYLGRSSSEISYTTIPGLTKTGFNTTFGFLARGTFTFREMSWILIKVFFGSSYLGFVRTVFVRPIPCASLTLLTRRMLLNR